MNNHDKIELPPLPESRIVSYQTDSTMRSMELRTHSDEAMQDYARTAIEADRKQKGEVVVTKTQDGEIIAVTRQDEEGRILSVIAEADRQRRGEPVNEEELLAAREALIDMGYLWDGDQWVEVDPPSKTAEQDPEWPDFARMEASLQRLKERLVFENGRRKDLEQRLREKRNG